MLTKFSTHDLQLVNPVVRFRGEPAELQLQGLWTIIPRRESDGTYTVCFKFEDGLPDSPEFKSNVVLQDQIDLSKYQAHKDALDQLGTVQDEDDSYW